MFLTFFMRLVWAFLANSLAIYDDLQPGIFLSPLILGNVVLFFPKIVFFFPVTLFSPLLSGTLSPRYHSLNYHLKHHLGVCIISFYVFFSFWGENFTVWHFSALVFCVHLSTYSIYWVFLLLCILYYYY